MHGLRASFTCALVRPRCRLGVLLPCPGKFQHPTDAWLDLERADARRLAGCQSAPVPLANPATMRAPEVTAAVAVV
ncbi:hypothetical protein FHY13_002587 [Xanthomonas arboricola]|nr:hypothetical protein [Xanthomonas euroxanthea]